MVDRRMQCIDALRKLTKTKKIEAVSVIEVANLANVKRTTFYYNFLSIRDVVVCYFLKIPLSDMRKIDSIEKLIDSINKRFAHDQHFIEQLISSPNYRSVVFDAVNAWTQLFFRNQKLEAMKANFYASGFATTFLDCYISSSKDFAKLRSFVESLK